MKKPFLALLALALLLPGCASYIRFREAKDRIPAPRPGLARVYFYRDYFTANFKKSPDDALEPEIRMNGKLVGLAKVHTVFFADVPGGTYNIQAETESPGELTFKVAAGDTRYVRMNAERFLRIGHIEPELVPKDRAEPELEELSYFDPAPVRIPASAALQK